MKEAVVYNVKGEKAGTVKLPERVFGAAWNSNLVHQVVVSEEANRRVPVAHSKDRGEVRGGGRKPWRQKGTGRARHGSIRSPLWRGGGVTFGPRNDKVFKRKVNRKMRQGALYSTLSRKLKEGEILFIDSLSIPSPRTKEARTILHSLSLLPGFEKLLTKSRNAALLALVQRNDATQKSFQNFKNMSVGEVRNLSSREVLAHKYLLVVSPKESVEILEKKQG